MFFFSGLLTDSDKFCTEVITEKQIRIQSMQLSHRYWANFSTCTRLCTQKDKKCRQKTTWVHKRVQVQVPEYRSRFPSTGPLLVFYLGPGSRVQVQVPKYRFWTMKSPNFLKCHKMILIFDIHLQDCCWSICHVSWVIGFKSGLRNIDFSWRY